MSITNRTSIVFKLRLSLTIFVAILILYNICGEKSTLNLPDDNPHLSIRGVIVTLIRSTNQSVFLTINMIHSIVRFYPSNNSFLYPIIIFHDENFTSTMRQQILSCVLTKNKRLQISFALVNFQTKVTISPKSPATKPIGYRLMCRFWTYDVFYHPAIIEGKYDYLMRMDDDSYFSDTVQRDIFLYMKNQSLDYAYRAVYMEETSSILNTLGDLFPENEFQLSCIYNNFFVLRLKWFYESKSIQKLVNILIKDDAILREYMGDGCVHALMLQLEKQVKVEHLIDFPYGHNFHVMPSHYSQWGFYKVEEFKEEIYKSCHQLTVLRGSQGDLIRLNLS